ncbi:hypothetical protein Cgig2_002533 [Carnegiea gigantea]|uniref:Uncharacterized protein n=1 Tax=Carnegiea gigantea TaxID=171969 RepID=A0A9Q1QPX4_9CARY|nr:hypothetical protein Cgig2_002533 [Carnegiea gigantea]
MGLHLVVLGKLHLLAKSHTTTTPLVASMVVSFVLRVASNIPIIQRICSDLIYSLRLFVFQVTRINQSQAIVGDATGSRWWSRALRSGGGAGSTTQMVASLAWPYLLRVCLSFRVAHQDLVSATRLFLFQLARIITHDHHESPVDQTANNRRRRSRWDRAIRLVGGRLAEARRRVVVTIPYTDVEANLHVFSMISL